MTLHGRSAVNNYAIVRSIKEAVLSHEPRPQTVRLGVYRGITRRMAPHNTQQVIWGTWERETYPYLRRALARAEWMVDVGAGFGEMAALFAVRSKASPIYAIEPGTDASSGRVNNITDTLLL